MSSLASLDYSSLLLKAAWLRENPKGKSVVENYSEKVEVFSYYVILMEMCVIFCVMR